MELNKSTIGKVNKFDEKQRVGEITSLYDTYFFTMNDVQYDNIKKGDLVKFRAERIHDQNKAFFIKKYEMMDNIGGKIAKGKIYKINE